MTVLVEEWVWDEARELIDAAESPLVLAHKRPDVDAISSMTILGSMFETLGKHAVMATEKALPEQLLLIPGSDAVANRLPSAYDLVICVDSSDAENLSIPGGMAP